MEFLPCLIVLLACVSLPVSASLCTSVSSSGCVCTTGNGTVIDLGAAFVNPTWQNLTDPDNLNSAYILSPCVDVHCGQSNDARGCQQTVDPNNNNALSFHVLGRAKTVTWAGSTTTFIVTFGDGDTIYNGNTRNLQITGRVDTTATAAKYSFDGESDPQVNPLIYSFSVTNAAFGPGAAGGGDVTGIAGIIIMILLLVALASYFIIGAIVMYTVKGARGVEMIPNVTFWKDLPFLIKDGFVFTFGPCVNAIRNKGGYSAL